MLIVPCAVTMQANMARMQEQSCHAEREKWLVEHPPGPSALLALAAACVSVTPQMKEVSVPGLIAALSPGEVAFKIRLWLCCICTAPHVLDCSCPAGAVGLASGVTRKAPS